MSELIAKFLHKKHLRGLSFDNVTIPMLRSYTDLCRFCELPLNIDILGDTDLLKCGHIFHRICLNHNSRICCICKIAFH